MMAWMVNPSEVPMVIDLEVRDNYILTHEEEDGGSFVLIHVELDVDRVCLLYQYDDGDMKGMNYVPYLGDSAVVVILVFSLFGRAPSPRSEEGEDERSSYNHYTYAAT